MSAPKTRLAWSRPRQRAEVRGFVRGTILRSTAELTMVPARCGGPEDVAGWLPERYRDMSVEQLREELRKLDEVAP